MSIEHLRVLLIQVRALNLAAGHERHCIMENTGLGLNQLDFINLALEPKIDPARYEQVDAIVIGGSGSHSATSDDPFTEGLIDDVKRMVDLRKPLFGSCWGHQFIARALGGEVIQDPERGEVGVIDISSTPAIAGDPVFGACPAIYPALSGHHDRVSTLPPGATELAFSALCPNHAFRIDGLPIYGAQYHAELTPEQLMHRLEKFRQYMPDEDEFQAMKAQMRPTPAASAVLLHFLELAQAAC